MSPEYPETTRPESDFKEVAETLKTEESKDIPKISPTEPEAEATLTKNKAATEDTTASNENALENSPDPDEKQEPAVEETSDEATSNSNLNASEDNFQIPVEEGEEEGEEGALWTSYPSETETSLSESETLLNESETSMSETEQEPSDPIHEPDASMHESMHSNAATDESESEESNTPLLTCGLYNIYCKRGESWFLFGVDAKGEWCLASPDTLPRPFPIEYIWKCRASLVLHFAKFYNHGTEDGLSCDTSLFGSPKSPAVSVLDAQEWWYERKKNGLWSLRPRVSIWGGEAAGLLPFTTDEILGYGSIPSPEVDTDEFVWKIEPLEIQSSFMGYRLTKRGIRRGTGRREERRNWRREARRNNLRRRANVNRSYVPTLQDIIYLRRFTALDPRIHFR